MLSYAQLPDQARLWIYPASRELTEREVADLRPSLEAFAKAWTSHRRELLAYADVWERRFLVLGVDEAAAAASGCSIDASVRFVRDLGERLDVDFFDRMLFFVRRGDRLEPHYRDAFAEAYASGDIDDGTTVIDPLVATKAAAITGFEKRLADSWHARFVGA